MRNKNIEGSRIIHFLTRATSLNICDSSSVTFDIFLFLCFDFRRDWLQLIRDDTQDMQFLPQTFWGLDGSFYQDYISQGSSNKGNYVNSKRIENKFILWHCTDWWLLHFKALSLLVSVFLYRLYICYELDTWSFRVLWIRTSRKNFWPSRKEGGLVGDIYTFMEVWWVLSTLLWRSSGWYLHFSSFSIFRTENIYKSNFVFSETNLW